MADFESSAEVGSRTYRSMVELPPGAAARIVRGSQPTMSIPLWRYWLEIAEEHCDLSTALRAPDQQLDAMSAALAAAGGDSEGPKVPEFPEADSVKSMRHALISVAAAAHAVDGLYGSVKPLISTPAMSAARHRQILETLKLGFHVGRLGQRWAEDLVWLFDTRDGVVHHAEEHRPLVVARVTAETVVYAGPETYQLTSESARRAAGIARALIDHCLAYPKDSTREWVATITGEPDDEVDGGDPAIEHPLA